MSMSNHISGKNKCRKCSKYSLKDNKYWASKCKEIWGNEYLFLEEVNNVNKKIKIKHNICGNILSKSMSNFIHNKRGCEYCSKKFYGEIYIKKFLDIENIIYIEQKTFDGLINPNSNRKLKVDFYLPEMNIVIEVDGVQHYKPIYHWGGDKAFEDQKYRDNIKDKFFENTDIKFIRINNKKIKNIKTILYANDY